jgi:hypothetical protein
MVVAQRSRPSLVLLLLVSGMVLSSSAASAGAPDRRPALPKGATDITDTAKGQKLIREAKGATPKPATRRASCVPSRTPPGS